LAQTFRIEVAYKPGAETATAIPEAAHQLTIDNVTGCRMVRLFFLRGDLDHADADRISRELLADPVTEVYCIDERVSDGVDHSIDVTLLPGVTDPAAENLVRAAHLLGMPGVQRAATGTRYLIDGILAPDQLKRLAREVCANPVIQRYCIDAPIDAPFFPYQDRDETVETIALRAASDDDLLTISRERRLSLNLAEMDAIRAYFRAEERDPTDAELEMLAQTWSEHCVHKTFKAVVDYSGPDGSQTIDGILKTYIRAATEKLAKPWVHSAFVDNAGIIAFDETTDLAFKVETHNRPSAIEPFGGANTGVGGVIRDVIGVSARPIANTDMLFFGLPDTPHDALHPGTLHPRRVADGVVSGIEDYGNKMGLPTVNGAIYYHPGYTSNPLVFCGCVGVLPHGAHRTGAQPGDLIVVIGGRTGRDGLRGATFSSMEIDAQTGTVSGGAVQIGHPIHEKQAMEAILRARDEGLYHAITDCGAGGLSSAVGEMGEAVGARIQLADVPLKYPGLRPWEIWLSEAQERMVLAVPPEHWPRLQAICAGQNIEAVTIGTFEPTGRLQLFYGDKPVGDLTMRFLHDGLPRWHLRAEWQPPTATPPTYPADEDFGATLLALLAHPNIASKEAVIRRYDHEVLGGTALKPLIGADDHGPGDAAVLVPPSSQRSDNPRGFALANGLCPTYGAHDPYAMAWAAVDEAVRNLVASGADPDTIAILDNFCWGNTGLPDRMGALVRCAQGCHDAALAYETPFISGKDSLNNEYLGADGQRHPIPGTLVISALGIVPDVTQAVSMDLKAAGNALYLVGATRDELGGSHYHLLHDLDGGTVPPAQPDAPARYRALHRAMRAGLVRSCHDLSEGGLAVAAAEMCIAGRLGAFLELDAVPAESDRALLFSESSGRLLVEVDWQQTEAYEQEMAGQPLYRVGTVVEIPMLAISGRDRDDLMQLDLAALEAAWRGTAPVIDFDLTLHEPEAPPQPGPVSAPSIRADQPRVLILHADGTNRDHDAYRACELAGGAPEIVHVNQLMGGEQQLGDYHMLVVPGGFSYGDDLGAGALWALDLRHRMGDAVARFIESGRPVLGICNGFQALVKAGFLPGTPGERPVTLARNRQAQFECRWVHLQSNPASDSPFLRGLDAPIYCPVAHGEGRVAARDAEALTRLEAANLIALTYVDADGAPVEYPGNPNGSDLDIAGLTNAAGNVLGLMPHPENHIFGWQHPRHRRGESGLPGLRLFENAIRFA
jgi:phosphoribosylformylglycinamidine synthase